MKAQIKRMIELFSDEKKKAKLFPENPFGNSPRANRETYLQLYQEAAQVVYPEIDHLENKLGYSINRQWLNDLALHTQVVIKKSKLNYQHGRVLYSILCHYLGNHNKSLKKQQVTILETGTARGFSAVCMAKALIDSNVAGKIISLDILPHNSAMFWNCIDDHEGKKTRQELLAAWEQELQHIVFIQGWTKEQLNRTGLSRIHFAFLDAQHTKEDVLNEYRYVCDRQELGDIIVFDDVTPNLFDGVVDAINQIELQGLYDIERLTASNERGYAIAKKIKIN